MSESSESACPICTDPMDLADLSFKPCPCGYQMCSFCFKQIQEMNGKCPACRQPYDPDAYKFTPPDQQEIAQQIKSKRKKEKKKPAEPKEVTNRKSLANVRVIQRNLVYVTNLSVTIAKEEILRRYEYFGQYGKIEKIVINKNNLFSVNSPYGPSVSAYITFESKNDALACITAIDNFWIENRPLKASFGTTKYCTFFLRNQQCVNPDCMYLHDLGASTDSFTKDEISSGKHNMVDPLPMALELTEEEMNYIDETAPPTVLPRRYTTPDVPSPCAPGEENAHAHHQDNQGSSHDGLAPSRPTLRSAMEFRPKNKKSNTPSTSVWASAPSTAAKSSINLEEEKDAWPSLESASSSADPAPSSHKENGRLRKQSHQHQQQHHTQSQSSVPATSASSAARSHALAASSPAQPPTVVTPPPDDEIWEAPPGLRASQLASMAAAAANTSTAVASSSSQGVTSPPSETAVASTKDKESSGSAQVVVESEGTSPSSPEEPTGALWESSHGERGDDAPDDEDEEGDDALNPWGRSFTPTPSPSLFPIRSEDDVQPWEDEEEEPDHEGPHVPVPALLSDRPPGLRLSQDASLAHERMKTNIMGHSPAHPSSHEQGPGPRWWAHPTGSSTTGGDNEGGHPTPTPPTQQGHAPGVSPSSVGDPWHPWSLSSSSGLPVHRMDGGEERPGASSSSLEARMNAQEGPRYEWHQPPSPGPFSSPHVSSLSQGGSHSSEEGAALGGNSHGSYGSDSHPHHDSRQLLRSILPNVNVSFRPSSSPAMPPGLNHGSRPPPAQPNWQLFQDNPSTPLFGGVWGTPSTGAPPTNTASGGYPGGPPGLNRPQAHNNAGSQVWQNYFFNHPVPGSSPTPGKNAGPSPTAAASSLNSTGSADSHGDGAMDSGAGHMHGGHLPPGASPFSRLQQQNMNQPLFSHGVGPSEASGPFRPSGPGSQGAGGMPPSMMNMFSGARPSPGPGMAPPGLGRPSSYDSNPFRQQQPQPGTGPMPGGLMMGGGAAWAGGSHGRPLFPHGQEGAGGDRSGGAREYGDSTGMGGPPGSQGAGGFPPSLMNSLWTSRPMMGHAAPPSSQGYPGMQPRSIVPGFHPQGPMGRTIPMNSDVHKSPPSAGHL